MAAIDPKAVAHEIGTDAKTLRRFLRSHHRAMGLPTPGIGGRWELDSDDVDAIADAFKAWRKGGMTVRARFLAPMPDDADVEDVED